MQGTTHTWEPTLRSLAMEALKPTQPVGSVQFEDSATLDSAYDHCAAVTAEHSKSFQLASSLLPRPKRKAVRALYAFCRVTDDIVDRAQGDPVQVLASWRAKAIVGHPDETDPVLIAWADTRNRYRIPIRYAEQLISGVSQDLSKADYETFDELAAYSYRVASTVGLMSMHIIGFSSERAIPYAIKLGVALQLTNILRDVGEDWHRGRVYLPADELERFGISHSDIAAGAVTPAWRGFMRFQIARTRQLYAESRPGIRYLYRSGRYAIAAAAGLYEAILDGIEANDYDVFTRRAQVSNFGKLSRLPRIWLESRLLV